MNQKILVEELLDFLPEATADQVDQYIEGYCEQSMVVSSAIRETIQSKLLNDLSALCAEVAPNKSESLLVVERFALIEHVLKAGDQQVIEVKFQAIEISVQATPELSSKCKSFLSCYEAVIRFLGMVRSRYAQEHLRNLIANPNLLYTEEQVTELRDNCALIGESHPLVEQKALEKIILLLRQLSYINELTLSGWQQRENRVDFLYQMGQIIDVHDFVRRYSSEGMMNIADHYLSHCEFLEDMAIKLQNVGIERGGELPRDYEVLSDRLQTLFSELSAENVNEVRQQIMQLHEVYSSKRETNKFFLAFLRIAFTACPVVRVHLESIGIDAAIKLLEEMSTDQLEGVLFLERPEFGREMVKFIVYCLQLLGEKNA